MRIPVQALLFDLDGTLVDSRADIAAAANAALEPLGFGPFALEEVIPHVGQGAALLLASLAGRDVSAPEIQEGVQRFIAYYRQNLTRHTRLYAGMLDVLEYFRHLPLLVVSNKPAVLARGVLEELGVASRFTAIYGGDSFARKKPDPLPVLEAIRPLALMPGDVVMVGDSAFDVLAGKRAGALTCGVLYGLGNRLELEQAGADLLINDAREMIDLYT